MDLRTNRAIAQAEAEVATTGTIDFESVNGTRMWLTRIKSRQTGNDVVTLHRAHNGKRYFGGSQRIFAMRTENARRLYQALGEALGYKMD